MSLVQYGSSSEESGDDDTKTNNECEKVVTKRKEPVKIIVPSLSEYDNEDVTPSKKPKYNKSSCLLSMLPPPKYSATIGKSCTLVPHSVSKKTSENKVKFIKPQLHSATTKPSKNASSPVRSTKAKGISLAKECDDDGEGASNTDFFSLESTPQVQPSSSMFSSLPMYSNTYLKRQPENPLPFATESASAIADTLEADEKIHNYNKTSNALPEQTYLSHVNSDAASCQYSSDSNYMTLPEQFSSGETNEEADPDVINDERFLRLQGKKQRALEKVDIVDVCVDSQLASKTEWHTKSITEEKKVSFSRKKGEMPTQQQRRKHQITYLAFQAKERELDLKNQWAQNRLTKRETQSKYGF